MDASHRVRSPTAFIVEQGARRVVWDGPHLHVLVFQRYLLFCFHHPAREPSVGVLAASRDTRPGPEEKFFHQRFTLIPGFSAIEGVRVIPWI